VNRIRFTEPAAQDIEAIYDYIALDNVTAVDGLIVRLQMRWNVQPIILALVESVTSYDQICAVLARVITFFFIARLLTVLKLSESCMVREISKHCLKHRKYHAVHAL
jgi:hypothetical protein